MSETTPTTDDGAPEPARRFPFNEVSVLFPLLTLYTFAYLGLMIADFALKKSLELPYGILPVYIALVGAYAADKEIRRWLGNPEPPRKGSVFVYIWLLLFLALYIVYVFRPEFTLPKNLLSVSLQVLGIFFGSKASKYVHDNHGGGGQGDTDRERMILELIAAKGQVTRQMVVDELNISRATAGRLLSELEGRAAIIRQGTGKGTYYILPQQPDSPT